MTDPARKLDAHLWARDPLDFYIEPNWVSARLFQEEKFEGDVIDPACGTGRIPLAAADAELSAAGTDIVQRWDHAVVENIPVRGLHPTLKVCDFFHDEWPHLHERWRFPHNLVCNPPFKHNRAFALKALAHAERKVAMIFPVRVLNAAGTWLKDTPLYRVWLLSPRPSMPPGAVIAAGGKVGGGTVDFCWLVWLRGYEGAPELKWLHREGAAAR